MDYIITFDGGSKGNPGRGYGSYQIVRARDGKERIQRLEYGDRVTNNEAEYLSLIRALETLVKGIRLAGNEPGQFALEVRGDSRLVIEQVAGRWKVKEPRLQPFQRRAQELLREFGSVKLTWHRRERSVDVLGH